jgi:hypothetical protein
MKDSSISSASERFVERGVSLGGVVIKQGDHLLSVRGTRNPRAYCIEPIFGA